MRTSDCLAAASVRTQRRSEHDRQRRGSRLVGGSSRRAVVQCRRVPESRRRTLRRRAADHGDARYQFRKNVDLVIAKDTRIAEIKRRDPVRDSQPDEYREVQRRPENSVDLAASAASPRNAGSCGSGSSASATSSDAFVSVVDFGPLLSRERAVPCQSVLLGVGGR